MFLKQLQKEQAYVKLRTTEEKTGTLSYTESLLSFKDNEEGPLS